MSSPMISLKRLTLCLALALGAIVVLITRLDRASAQSGPPQVVYTGPAANSVSVAPSTSISVTFSQPMSPTTLTSRTLRVHGSMSGRLSGTLRYDDATRTATFDPAQDLKPGELVAAGLTTATQDITGTALAAPYGWTFVAQAPYGSARFVPASPPRYDVGSQPYSVYGADLDQDGDVDLVTANSYADTISILLNDGRGAFNPASPRDYAVGNGPYAVRGADLDGDGDVDLATVNRWGRTLSVLLNDGDGHLTPATPRDYVVGDPQSVCLVDLDGDGDVDAATVNLGGDSISVISNNGNGTFTPFTPRDYTVGNAPYDISCADLDGDGDMDLATANLYSDNVSLLFNDGDGSFVPASPRDYPAGDGPWSLWSADWDGDGDVDLATTNFYADSVSILSNVGAGRFTSTVSGELAVHDGPRAIQGADLDGDGDLDLVSANTDSDDVSVLLNVGDGVFMPAAPRDYAAGDRPYSVYAADLDGDADLDLAIADYYDDQVSILLNFGLEIEKTLLTPTGWPGMPVTYTLSYTSYDSGTMRRAVITDQLPISLTNAHYTYSGPVVTPTDGLTHAWQIAPLPPGATGMITISAIVSPNLPARNGDTFDNHAVIVHYGGRLTDTATLLLDVGLEIEKSVLTPTGWPGLPVTYTVRYANRNLGTMRGVVITDHLPISLTNAHYIYSGPVITPTDGLTYAWQVAPLPPGVTGMITLSAILSPAISTDSTLDNHAVIAHHGERLTDTAALFVDATPKLWVDKSAAPLSAVEPGDYVTYTVQVTVSGVLTTSGWLTDALPAGTHFVTATPGFDSSTGGLSITWTLPSGIHRPLSTFQYTVVVTVVGSTRLATNLARAVYPGVLTATDTATIWVWDSIPEGACRRDIALVFDRSGSMGELTRCYGCWDQQTQTTHPLPFGNHCDDPDPLFYQGYAYVSIEAEHYSSYETLADYHWDQTQFPKTWWAMQRQPNRNASGPDTRGAWMMVGPHSEGALHYPIISDIVYPPDLYTTPRLDYDFTVPTAGNYYVWIRAQGGNQFWANSAARRSIHVGLNGTPMATGQTSQYGPYNDGASSNNWRWTRILRLDGLSADTNYTLNFWAAGPGFRLDKIVLTNDTRTNLMDNGHPLDWDTPGVSDAGPVETHGRTGWACLGPGSLPYSDPRFEPVNPVTGELDDLYDDFQPIRTAQEAAKGFVRQLNPVLDQIAYVWYSSVASIREELYCQEHYGICEDFENVVAAIGSTYASGSTNIAGALWYGLLTLLPGDEPEPTGTGLPPGPDTGPTHYGRAPTYGTLILITDGQANTYPALPSGYGNCYSDDLWPDQPGESDSQRRARECVVWFALRARDIGVAIQTIGLGVQADHELLAYVAELTGGWYYYAPEAGDLYAVLEAIETQTTSDCLFSGVEVVKRVTPQPIVTAGERLTYTIETALSGWIRTSPLELYDDVPAQTVFITATPGFVSEDPLVWSLPSGTFAEPLTLTHTVVLSATGPAGVLTNTVSIVNDYFSGTGPVLASESVTVSVLARPTYQLRKRVAPSARVTVGQRVTYTLVVTTSRPDLPAILSDTLPPGTAFVSASGDYAPEAPAPGETLAWSLAPGAFVNGQVTRTLVLSVTDVPPGGLLANQATIASVSDSATLDVLARPTYQLRKRVTPSAFVTVGQRVTYTLVVTTNRPDLPAILSDTLPPGTAFVSASGDHTPPAPAPGEVLAWSLAPGSFVAGVAQRTLVLSVTAVPSDGLLTNVAAVAGVSDSAVLTVLPGLAPRPDLVVTQLRHGPAQPLTGQSLNFTVTVRNQGHADAPGWVAVELYVKDDGAGPPTGPADHAGGWCADPPACQQTRSDYLAFLYGLAVNQSRTLNYAITPDQAGSFYIYVQADVNQVSAATDEYGAFLESDESNNVFGYGPVTIWEARPNKLYLPLITKSLP
jgi:uncharacterized repeat protein (TIGR01451 family)